jgi:hypothetical protein
MQIVVIMKNRIIQAVTIFTAFTFCLASIQTSAQGPVITIHADGVQDSETTNTTSFSVTFTSDLATANFNLNDITLSNCELTDFQVVSFEYFPPAEGSWNPCTNHSHEVSNGGYIVSSTEHCQTMVSLLNEHVNSQEMEDAGFGYSCHEDHPNHFAYGDGIVGNGNQNVSIGSALLENASGVPFNNGNCCGQFGMENCHADASLVPTFEAFLNNLYASSYGNFEFTATITAQDEGLCVISIPANAFSDSDGNGNVTSSFEWTYDETRPSMVITAAEVQSGDTSLDEALSITFTSSEDTDDFNAGDVLINNGALTDFSAASTTVYTAIFTPAAFGATIISVPQGSFTDAAGNANTGSSDFEWTYEVPPAEALMYTFGQDESHRTENMTLAIQQLNALTGGQASPFEFIKGSISTSGDEFYMEFDIQAVLDAIEALDP